jgi:hypothetical protein
MSLSPTGFAHILPPWLNALFMGSGHVPLIQESNVVNSTRGPPKGREPVYELRETTAEVQ